MFTEDEAQKIRADVKRWYEDMGMDEPAYYADSLVLRLLDTIDQLRQQVAQLTAAIVNADSTRDMPTTEAGDSGANVTLREPNYHGPLTDYHRRLLRMAENRKNGLLVPYEFYPYAAFLESIGYFDQVETNRYRLTDAGRLALAAAPRTGGGSASE